MNSSLEVIKLQNAYFDCSASKHMFFLDSVSGIDTYEDSKLKNYKD